jgi:ElaB/YqjD/DUF883 family membrane-anchored ribosome-binding protein
MENEDVIRDQMEDTRTSLSEKLETLEKQVVDTVQGATCNVAETVEAVKETVQETVASVKDSVQQTLAAVTTSVRQSVHAVRGFFDIPAHVDHHPWAMVGGSALLGFALGALLRGKKREVAEDASARPAAQQPSPLRASSNGRHAAPEPARQSSWDFLTKFAPEISKLKTLALGALMGAIREKVLKAAPPDMGSSLEEFLNNITEKITGEPTGPRKDDNLHPHETMSESEVNLEAVGAEKEE